MSPVLPLKAEGVLYHLGWDIPTKYAIDANGQCWMNDAHGGDLVKTTPDSLIASAREEGSGKQNELRQILGLPQPEDNGSESLLRQALPYLEHHENSGDDRLDELLGKIRKLLGM